MTQHLGLIGYPIDHSLSPVIQMAAFQALHLDWDYELFPCPDAMAARELILSAKAAKAGSSQRHHDIPELLGLNVTTPYKALAAELADLPSQRVQLSHAANTLGFVNTAAATESAVPDSATSDSAIAEAAATFAAASSSTAQIHADTTDGRAVIRVLEDAGTTWPGSHVVLCGSGNVARSILVELQRLPLAAITVLSRKPGQLRLPPSPPGLKSTPPLRVCPYSEAATLLPTAQLLIDATTLGMQPDDPPVLPAHLLHASLLVLDLVYAHGTTALVAAAQAAGAQALDGLGVLIEQAALSLEFWGRLQGLALEAPRDVMQAAARRKAE